MSFVIGQSDDFGFNSTTLGLCDLKQSRGTKLSNKSNRHFFQLLPIQETSDIHIYASSPRLSVSFPDDNLTSMLHLSSTVVQNETT